jgi:hypothetical protein
VFPQRAVRERSVTSDVERQWSGTLLFTAEAYSPESLRFLSLLTWCNYLCEVLLIYNSLACYWSSWTSHLWTFQILRLPVSVCDILSGFSGSSRCQTIKCRAQNTSLLRHAKYSNLGLLNVKHLSNSVSMTDWLTVHPIALNRVLLDKLIITNLVKNFPAVYGTRRFITSFVTVRHWSLSWVKCMQSTHSLLISLKSILKLFTYLHLALLSGLFLSSFLTKNLYAFFVSSICATGPTLSPSLTWLP